MSFSYFNFKINVAIIEMNRNMVIMSNTQITEDDALKI